MKNFYKKLSLLLGAYLTSKEIKVPFGIDKLNETNINEYRKNQDNLVIDTFLAHKDLPSNNNINELKNTKVYLLTTKDTISKSGKNILLLLEPEDRLNSETAIVGRNAIRFIFPQRTRMTSFQYNLKKDKKSTTKGLYRTFRKGKSYYLDNLGGYKAICPIFYNKNDAEDFLVKNIKDSLDFLKTQAAQGGKTPLQIKNFMNSIKNTRVVTLNLGDLFEYYSLKENKALLNKMEFLFLPSLEQDLIQQ